MTRGTKTLALALIGVMATAMPAAASDFGFGFNFDRIGKKGRGFGFGFEFGRSAPVPVAVPAPVVVPMERVWVPPMYQTVSERVWVPTAQTHYRDVPVVDAFGRVVSYRREPYTVTSGYWSEVQRQVLVREGYWTMVPAGSHPHPAGPPTAHPYGPDTAGFESQSWGNGYSDHMGEGAVQVVQRSRMMNAQPRGVVVRR